MNSIFDRYDPHYEKQKLLCANSSLDHTGIESLSTNDNYGNQDMWVKYVVGKKQTHLGFSNQFAELNNNYI